MPWVTHFSILRVDGGQEFVFGKISERLVSIYYRFFLSRLWSTYLLTGPKLSYPRKESPQPPRHVHHHRLECFPLNRALIKLQKQLWWLNRGTPEIVNHITNQHGHQLFFLHILHLNQRKYISVYRVVPDNYSEDKMNFVTHM